MFQAERRVLEKYHLPGLRQVNVKIQVLPIYFRGLYLPESALRQTVLTVNTFLQEMEESADNFAIIKTKQELETVRQGDKVGVILAMEGADGLGRDIDLVRLFFELGLRMLGLTWNRANSLAEGCEEDTGAGLTVLGRELVKNLASYPVILDVSHLSEASFWDALKQCQGPVLASHSNSAAVCPHHRNLTDDQLMALAERGGIVGLNFYPEFVSHEEALLPGLIRHVEHIAHLVGLDHLALGPDFIDYLPATLLPGEVTPPGNTSTLPGVGVLADFYEALRAHGFLEEEAALIMGKNALRFLAQALPD
jgi:membrane dipeptidase